MFRSALHLGIAGEPVSSRLSILSVPLTLESNLRYDQGEFCDYTGTNGHANAKTAVEALRVNAYPATEGGDKVCYAVCHHSQAEFDRAMEEDEPYKEYYTVGEHKYRVSRNAISRRHVKLRN